MADEKKQDQEQEREEQDGELLPEREAMSIIDIPGAGNVTLPVEPPE